MDYLWQTSKLIQAKSMCRAGNIFCGAQYKIKIWDPVGVLSLYLYIMSPSHEPTASIHSWCAISEWLQPPWCWERLDQQWARGWSSHLLDACGAVSQRRIGFALPRYTIVGTFDPNHSPPGPSFSHCPTWRVVVLIGARRKQADAQEHVLVRLEAVSWGTMCGMRIQASGICLISHRPSFKNHKFRQNMKYFETANTEQ